MIVLDLETTGLDKTLHSIISIGALDFENPGNQFYVECGPFAGAKIEKAAIEVNGATEDWLEGKNRPTLKDTFLQFKEWAEKISDRDLAGSNITFDVGFLEETAKRYKMDWKSAHHPVDINGWYRKSLLERHLSKPERYNTDTILQYVGLNPEPKPHNALMGAKVEAEGFARFLGVNLLPEFAHIPIPEYFIDLRTRTEILGRRGRLRSI